jgi:hypothetical protein
VPACAGTGVFNFIVMRTKYFIYILAILAIASACCDTDDPIIDVSCLEQASFPSESVDDTTYNCCPDCLVDPEEIYSSAIPFDYSAPCFDPSNSNRIAYYRFDNTKFDVASEIWVFDLCSGEKRKIVGNALYGIDWSVKDWIIYTADDQQIYMIKSNGDSLTKITSLGDYNRYPKWDKNGDKILFQRQGGGLSELILFDLKESNPDTITELQSIGAWDWVGENQISYVTATWDANTGITTQYLNKFDLTTRQSTLLHTLDIVGSNSNILLSTDYSESDNSIIWGAYGVIGKTDASTGAFKVIKDAYRQESFYDAVVSKDEKYILFDIRSRKLVDPCRYDSDYGLYIMDLNGKNQRRIKIE